MSVLNWFDNIDGKDCYISVMSVGEIYNGIKKLETKDANLSKQLRMWLTELENNFGDRILDITPQVALKWGELNNKRSYPVVDALIASTAIVHNLVLVTRNTKDISDRGVRFLNSFEEKI